VGSIAQSVIRCGYGSKDGYIYQNLDPAPANMAPQQVLALFG